MSNKARILFVDDEKRVLNSMRGLFRRDYELFLTTVGADAVNMASENDVDVVVADQRMPGLTGIEVLGKIKNTSPRTVRILLTGYADPEAVEGSINIGEVFRFLSKPCPPDLLRETLALAIEASRTAPVVQAQVENNPEPAPAASAESAASAASTAAQATQKPERSQPEPDVNAPVLQATTKTEVTEPPQMTIAAAPTRQSPDAPVLRTEVAAATPAPTPQKSASDLPPDTGNMPNQQYAAVHRTNEPATVPDSGKPVVVDSHIENDATQPALAVLDASTKPAYEAAKKQPNSHWQTVTNVVLSEDTVETTQENVALSTGVSQCVKDVGVIVFTVDPDFAESAIRAFSDDRTTILATSLVKVAQAVEQRQAGVLITDFTTDSGMLKKMIGTLKQYMPELVTIVVSSGRDTTDMINLINFGQVFRYILKPVDPIELRKDVNAAAIRCLQLLSNPESAKRHRVIDAPASTNSSATLNRFVGRIQEIQSVQLKSTNANGK